MNSSRDQHHYILNHRRAFQKAEPDATTNRPASAILHKKGSFAILRIQYCLQRANYFRMHSSYSHESSSQKMRMDAMIGRKDLGDLD